MLKGILINPILIYLKFGKFRYKAKGRVRPEDILLTAIYRVVQP